MANPTVASKPRSAKAELRRVVAQKSAIEAESLRSLAEQPKDAGRSSGQGMDGAPPKP